MDEAVVSVRIPNGADDDLTTEAERRLSRADGIVDVSTEGLRGLDPGLSATVVTVAVTVTVTSDRNGSTTTTALNELTGVEVVEAGSV